MRITQNRINELVDTLNDTTGVAEYHTSYMPQYGGWDLYIIKPDGHGHTRGMLGFDDRKSNREMYNYLTGVLAGIDYMRNTAR